MRTPANPDRQFGGTSSHGQHEFRQVLEETDCSQNKWPFLEIDWSSLTPHIFASGYENPRVGSQAFPLYSHLLLCPRKLSLQTSVGIFTGVRLRHIIVFISRRFQRFVGAFPGRDLLGGQVDESSQELMARGEPHLSVKDVPRIPVLQQCGKLVT